MSMHGGVLRKLITLISAQWPAAGKIRLISTTGVRCDSMSSQCGH